MPAFRPAFHLLPSRPRQLRLAAWLIVGLSLALPAPISAQTTPIRPDSVVVPSPAAPAPVVPDTVRQLVPPEPPPDADPTPGPVSRRAAWTILGACALLTISTLLLYNVRSR